MDDRIYARYMSDVAYFLSKLEAAPDSYYFIPIALAYNKLGKYDETISICRKGLEHFSSNCPARVLLAEAYLYKGDTDQARDLLFDVLMEDGDNYKALKLLGIIYQTMEMNDEAIKYLRGAFIRSPEDADLKKTLQELGVSTDLNDIIEDVTGHHTASSTEEEDEDAKTFLEIEQKIKNAELVMADLASDHSIMGPSRGNDEVEEEPQNTLSDDELENLIAQAGNITYTPTVQSDDDNSTFFDTSHLFGEEIKPPENNATLHGDSDLAANVEDIVAEYNRDYSSVLDGIPERATTPEDVDAIVAAFQRGETEIPTKKSPPKKEEAPSNNVSNDELEALINSFSEANQPSDSNELTDDELNNLLNSHEEMKANSNEVFNDEIDAAVDAHKEMRANSNEVFNDEIDAAVDAHKEMRANSNEVFNDEIDAAVDAHKEMRANSNEVFNDEIDAAVDAHKEMRAKSNEVFNDEIDAAYEVYKENNAPDEFTNDLLSALVGDDDSNDDSTMDLLSALNDDEEKEDNSTDDLLSILSNDEVSVDDFMPQVDEEGTTEDLLSELIGDDAVNKDSSSETSPLLDDLFSDDNDKIESHSLEFKLEDMISDDEHYLESDTDSENSEVNQLGDSSPFIQQDILDEIYESSKIDEEVEILENSLTSYNEDDVVTKDSLKELHEYRSLKDRQVDILEEALDKIRKKV